MGIVAMRGNTMTWVYLAGVVVVLGGLGATVMYLAGVDKEPRPVEVVIPDEEFPK